MNNLLHALLWLIIVGLIYVVVDWALSKMGLPDIINKVLTWALIAFVAIFIINIILTLVGHPWFSLPRLSIGGF